MSYLITEVHTLTIAAQKPKPTQSLQLHRSRKFINNVTPTFQSFSPTFKRPSIFGYKSQDSHQQQPNRLLFHPRHSPSPELFYKWCNFQKAGASFFGRVVCNTIPSATDFFKRENYDMFPDIKVIPFLQYGEAKLSPFIYLYRRAQYRFPIL